MPVAEWTPLYSNYDIAFVKYIRTFLHRSRPILCVFATPERAFSQAAKAIKKLTGTEPDLKTIPLPIISVNRTSQIYDPERFVNYTFRREFFNEVPQNFSKVERPRPEKLTYEVSLWARNLRHIDNIYGQMVRSLHSDYTYLTVLHPPPFGDMACFTRLTDPRNVSNLEPGQEQRSLRRIYPFLVDAWICYVPEDLGRVDEMTIELWESSDLETEETLLDVIEIG